MHISVMSIIFVSMAIPATDMFPGLAEDYQVNEIVSVLSPNSFQCKLDNYKPAPFVSFRVNLPATETPDKEELTKQILSERLGSAHQIELHNVKFRPYFRIDADLWLDGKPFLEWPVSETVQDQQEIQEEPENITGYQRPYSPPRQPPKPHGSVSPQVLLDTPVDCSMLDDNTPLSEALKLLSESVKPRLPLLVFWDDLRINALIEKETSIGVSGLGRMKLRQALDIIARSVSIQGPRLVFVIDGGIIKFGTDRTLLRKKVTEVYSVEDLTAMPSIMNMFNQRGIGTSRTYGNTGSTFNRE